MKNNTFDFEIEEMENQRFETKKGKVKKNNIGIKRFFAVLFLLGTMGIIAGLTLLYGPWNGFRDWLITTAMTTMTHQYYATWFYDEETINSVLENNKVIELDEDTNADLINIDTGKVSKYENEYERAILERDDENNDYKIIEINEKRYTGYLVAVYEPSRVETVSTKKLGTSGQYLTTMAQDNDALIAINGGGFDDPNFNSTGGSPLGITYSKGKMIKSKSYNGPGGIIGFTTEDKLILSRASESEAKNKNIRDCVTFGPFLITNGKASAVLGNGGWGSAPRTAIAQRKDGIVLFLIIDGRTASKPGADMDDLIDILQKYGAYNAANLDGGTSSVLVVNGTIVNDPIDSTGAHKTRPIATGFILRSDGKDNGDHSLVADKLGEE